MILELNKEKRMGTNFKFFITVLFIVFVGFLVLFNLFDYTTQESSEVKVPDKDWTSIIPSDFPRDLIIKFSEFLENNQTDLNLEMGYGPLHVRPIDFDFVAPQIILEPNIFDETHNTKVALVILLRFKQEYGSWTNAMIVYVYGPYYLKSKRPQDLEKVRNLIDYLGVGDGENP